MKEHFIPNENLKTQANKLFKGIVVNAYIEKHINLHSDKDGYFSDREVNNREEEYFNSIDFDKENELRYHAKNIILEFNNGAVVVFRNSEWALMSGLDEDIVFNKEDLDCDILGHNADVMMGGVCSNCKRTELNHK